MEARKKLLLTLAIVCAYGTGARAVDVGWNWNTTYTIPADGYTYTLDATVTLTEDLTVESGGILEVKTGGTITIGAGNIIYDNGTLNITGGTINMNGGSLQIGYDATGGICNLTTGAISGSSGSIQVGRSTGGSTASGTFNVSGGTLNLSGFSEFYIARSQTGSSVTGICNISGGTVTLDRTHITSGANTTGTLNITGGTVSINDEIDIGEATELTSNGTIQISGGTLNINELIEARIGKILVSGSAIVNNGASGYVYLGNSLGTSIFRMTGGTFNNNGGEIASGLGGTVQMLIEGGTFNMNSGAIYHGLNSNGNLNITGGTFNMAGGTIYNGYAGYAGTHTYISATGGTFNLAGGTIVNSATGYTGYVSICDRATFKLGAGSITAGAGTSHIDIFYVNTPVASGTLTIPGDKTMFFSPNSSFIVDTGGTLVNNGRIVRLYNNYFNYSNGTFTNNGTVDDFTTSTRLELPAFTIPPASTFSTVSEQVFFLTNYLHNDSANTFNVYGDVYTYSTIRNGDGSNAGTININYPGKLYLLGGELINGNASSSINVNTGGKLLNYHGTVDAASGSLNIAAGSTYNNVRGNNPNAYITASAGSTFSEDEEIILLDTFTLDSTWTITNKSTINGDGHKIIFEAGGAMLLQGPDASLLIKNAIVEDVSGNQIRCTDDTTTLSIDDVIWIQDANYTFSKGTLSVNGTWLITGADTSFTYSSDQACTIQQNAELTFDRDVTFRYDSPTVSNVTMIDGTSILHLQKATLFAVDDIRLTKGKIIFDDNVTFSIASGQNVYFGNSSAPDNVALQFDQNSLLFLTGPGTLTNQNV